MEAINYREVSTRENLEQIKQDFGEGSFILETKKTCVGCFMGMVSEMQIEISAVPSPAPQAVESADTHKTLAGNRFGLTNDVHVSPRAMENRQASLKAAITICAASQDYSNNFADNLEDEIPPIPKILRNELPAQPLNLKTPEIAQQTPSFYHQKTIAAQSLSRLLLEPDKIAENLQPRLPASNRSPKLLPDTSRGEFEFSPREFALRQQSLQSVSTQISHNLPGEISQSPFCEAYNELTACGVSGEIAHILVAAAIPQYKRGAIKANNLIKAALQSMFPALVKFAEDPLISNESAILALIGTTGVGKTTTVAKLAARLTLREGRRVELVTLDTYRIAAVEQLKAYAEIIGAGCHVVRSVWELDATLRKIPAGTTVLIDTTGTNPRDLTDQFELSEYLLQRSDIRKCLTLQATVNLQDAISAVRKFEMSGADCLALTKIDETTIPGALIEIIAESALPLAYLCAGQRVPEDLKVATPENFIARILNSRSSFGADS